MAVIDDELYNKLEYLGIIDNTGVRGRNFGASDYNEHVITVWAIWLDYPNLSEFKKMAIKYLLREKDTDPEELDIKKTIHYLEERLRQIEVKKKQSGDFGDVDPADNGFQQLCNCECGQVIG